MITTVKIYPVHSPLFWKAYLVQMRPYLLFVSGIAGTAGIAIGSNADTPPWKFILSFAVFFFAYGFGQALTDCFQTDTDKLSAPYRPLSKGIVSVRSVLLASITGLLCSGIILFALHPLCFILSALAVFGLATYSFIKKNVWAAGPFYNAWIVALLPAMGYFAVQYAAIKTFPSHRWPYIGVTFFSYASFVLIGYLKDIEADKATAYKTFPVVWGWNKTVLCGDAFAMITLLLFWWQSPANAFEIAAGITGSAIILYGQLKAHLVHQKNEKGALVPILSTVRSFILLHIAVILHYQQSWWWFMLVYYLLFELFLYRRPSRYQV